jgi:hypothetical protein
MQAKMIETETKFKGSGYAWILLTYYDGRVFTVREAQEGMVKAGIVSGVRCGFRRASDCITRMQKTSDASTSLQVNYKNWTGCLKYVGKNSAGEHLYCVTRHGRILGQKIATANSLGINLRQHNLTKRIDKQLKVTIAKRGYFRLKKVFDPLTRTKAIRNTRRA